MAMFTETNIDTIEKFKDFIDDEEQMDKLASFKAVSFNWDADEHNGNNRMSIHVLAPVAVKGKYHVFGEAHLRASYFCSLMEADRTGLESVAIPLLGLDMPPEKSAAIGLQMIFAYMHAVKETNLKLIYLVTRKEVYNKVGKMFGYVREFDLNKWTTRDYLNYEKHVFDRVKTDNHFSSIPGTDMVWRAFKVTHERGQARATTVKLNDMHKEMHKHTGTKPTMFLLRRKKYDPHMMAKEFVKNGVMYAFDECQNSLLDIRFNTSNFCGSNQVLRKLWIISNYHMYFQEHTGDALNLDPKSEQYKIRKRIFNQQKQLHADVVRLWNKTYKHAPFKCNCTLEHGYHENMVVFMTKLSYPDYIMDRWILEGRKFVLNYEDDPSFVDNITTFDGYFLHRFGDDLNRQAVADKDALQTAIENSVAMWLNSRTEVFAQQHAALLDIMDVCKLEDREVNGETSPELYDCKQFERDFEFGIDMKTRELLVEQHEAEQNLAFALEAEELEEAHRQIRKCEEALKTNRYVLHFENDLEIERSLRNRFFRARCVGMVNALYPQMPRMVVNDDGEEEEEDEDVPLDVLAADEDLWKKDDDVSCTVEEYIDRKLQQLNLQKFDDSSVLLDDPLNTSNGNPFDSTFGSNGSDSSTGPPRSSSAADNNPTTTTQTVIEDYPDQIDIGDPNIACPHCGAFSFKGERSWSCCKNGAVWIPPLKVMPSAIKPIFEGNYRNSLISTNAAFSMASVRYNRQSQGKKGIQSVKIKGLVSCHPSAINKHKNAEPAYANFIILNHSNEDIATKRYESVRGNHNKQLKKIFVDIQKYMDKHNRLYDAYKSMAEMEEEFKNDRAAHKFARDSRIKFRIVPPDELSNEDLKELNAHNGVYARPGRMSQGYITVAFTWDIEGTQSLPVGRTIYSKNPKAKPQEPLSIYSDLCDQMSYPLFFPDAFGGWGLHKYNRWVKKQKTNPDFLERVRDHVQQLVQQSEDPRKYYDLNMGDPELRRVVEETIYDTMLQPDDDTERRGPGQKRRADDDDGGTLPDQDDEEGSGDAVAEEDDHMSSGDVSEIEDDPRNFNEEQILAFDDLDVLQDAPINPEDVGQMANIRMVERGGEMVPMVDRRRKAVDIPFASDFPFWNFDLEDEEDDAGEEGEAPPQRGRHETHDEEYRDVDGPIENMGEENMEDERDAERQEYRHSGPFDDMEEMMDMEDEIDAERRRRKERRRRRRAEEDDYEHFEGAEVDPMADMVAEGEDMEVAIGAVNPENNDAEEDEDVQFGDENTAEANAMARHNDGVRVKNVGARQHVSLAEYSNFVMQDRRGNPCRFQGHAKTLGQLYLIDLACRIREMRMEALTIKRAEFPSATDRSAVMKVYTKMLNDRCGDKEKKQIGMLCTMPATVPGTSKYQRDQVMSAVTVANNLGNPHLFITFTGNPNWPEIKRACQKRNCQWADIPDIVNRVFKRKWETFLDDVVGSKKKSRKHKGKYIRQDGLFGPVVWYNYSVEFQQRGMPHCHLLVCLKNPITNAAQVDKIISAEVPEFPSANDPLFEEKYKYWKCVKDLMLHTPCEGDRSAYCNKEKKSHWKKCCKNFPKKLCKHTILSDNRYPDYKRSSGRVFIMHKNNISYRVGDEYVVAHNRQLLMKYNCHMNIEIVSSLKTMKYMFKYIHKGCDRVLLEATETLQRGSFAPDSMMLADNVFVPRNLDAAKVKQRQDEANRLMHQAGVSIPKSQRVALNECSYMMDMSAMTACEAAWRIAGFPMHGSSHIVHRAYIHEEGRDVMYTTRGVSVAQAGQMLKKPAKGMMAAWFEANQEEHQKDLPNGKKTADLTLDEMMSYYMFDISEQKFILRQRDHSHRIMSRIQAPQPRWLELTATRLLAQNRGLMNGDVEWENALAEIARSATPVECRRFFVSILVHCAPANPGQLWENHWQNLVNSSRSWTDEQKKAHALRHIAFLLRRHGMSLRDFELEQYDDCDLPQIRPEDDDDNPNAVRLTWKQHKEIGDRMFNQLNDAQKKFVRRALELDKTPNKTRMLFVDGPGGTGKTFCYKTIYHLLAARKRGTACVSHTGIAASLLPNGCTAHRKFSIPLEVEAEMTCKIREESPEAQELALLDCIIWDEVCMTDRRILDAVNVLLQKLKNNTLEFGGVLMIMGGDWRQILPIVDGITGPGVVDYTLKKSHLWEHIEKFQLTENRRALNDPQYAKKILEIGDGSKWAHKAREMVFIPNENVEKRGDRALADWVFPDVNDIDSIKSSALLTVDNKTAHRLNDMILNRLDGEVHEFRSVDSPDKDTGMAVDSAVFASETPNGMPLHRLRLKVGAQVVLLRNLSVEQGLCNGTRLTIKSFGDDILHCTVNDPGENSPDTVYLHRILMSPSGKGAKSCGFKRLQYPIRLAYAMTINKSQGQTLSRCGLVLHSPVFAHGQLYVAMSRVQKSADFRMWHTKRVYFPRDDDHFGIGILVRNRVFPEALREVDITATLESLEPPPPTADPPTAQLDDDARSTSSSTKTIQSSSSSSDDDAPDNNAANNGDDDDDNDPFVPQVNNFFNRLKRRITGRFQKKNK